MRIFSSFWQGGFEGADHITRLGDAVSMNDATGHYDRALEDYQALKAFNISAVRESVGWRLVESREGYDFSSVAAKMLAAKEMDIQISWTICHYGWPVDIDVFSEDFISRFARLCGALALFLQPYYDYPPVYSPINEISFTSWGLSVGMFPCSAEPCELTGLHSKRQLVKATLAACDAIWAADPRARILHCDPIIFMVPPDDSPEWLDRVTHWRAAQFQSWDMLSGAIEPELGGAPRYLDLIGANYYHDNQWESGSNQRLWWHLGDPRRRRLHDMLQELYLRYKRPILLAETSHVGSGRGAWIIQIASEIAQAQLAGVEILGICLYPIIDRPDWENPAIWNRGGLWDLDRYGLDPHTRILDTVYATALLRAQHMLVLFQRLLGASLRAGRNTFDMKEIIVFSHLRWEFVFQRPQHLMTRLAKHYQIFFIEEQIYTTDIPKLHLSYPAPNITVVQPHTPSHSAGFHDEQLAYMEPLLAELLENDTSPIAWFYTPMALPLLAAINPSLIIYDCMDELSAFEHAPRQLLQRESALLARANMVFTGGPSLYAAKADRHHNVHCFPSSVDAIHFEQALDRTNHHPLQDAIPHPRLGYYGVIDERMDLPLLSALADAHPDWQLIMVGPVVKIDPATLPIRNNIHYFGMQPYQALPQFLAGWDLCLMPFAMNASTRFISPTKVLEYMAAQLPIVSTAITDVVKPYGHVVTIAQDKESFITGCEKAFAMLPTAQNRLREEMKTIVDSTSWDNTAQAMFSLIESELLLLQQERRTLPSAANADFASPEKHPLRLTVLHGAHIEPVQCLILGAGPTGLSAAYHYGADAVLLERNASVGGLCRSVVDKGFTFDYAGHIMFSNDPYVLELYNLLLGDNLHWQEREAWVYTEGIFTRYPFQGALYGLPTDIIKECILGAIEARYGVSNNVHERIKGDRPLVDCCADGVAPEGGQTSQVKRAGDKESFEAFIYATWGAGIAKYFAIPYNKKLWKVPLSQMETSWLGGRVPLPDLGQIIAGAIEPVGKPMGPNARFGYPLSGGFQALMTGFLPLIDGLVETKAEITRLFPHQHIAVLADGRQYRYDQMISTMPLPELIRLIRGEAPEKVRAAAESLQHVSVRCVNLGINRADITDKHWIYFAGNTLFHRVFVQGNASPLCSPPNSCGLTCEITYSDAHPLPLEGQELIDRCIRECIEVGLFTAEDNVVAANQIDIPYAYVIYDHPRKSNVEIVRNWLLLQDITLAGRYSEWEYYNSDHAFIAGKNAAEKVKNRTRLRSGSDM